MPSEALTRAVAPADSGQAVEQASSLPPVLAALSGKAMARQIAESLPAGIDAEAFHRHALTLVKQTPKLLECDPASVAQGIVRGAGLGLDPDPALGQMWLVPRRTRVTSGGRDVWLDVATFQVGYRGLLDLAMRTGDLAKVEVKAVHRNDRFEARLGSDGGLRHEPDWFGDRGPIIGWYAYALRKDGVEMFEVLSVADAERHRDRFAPTKKNGDVYGPWVDHFDAMAMKTVFIKLAKWLPKQVEVAKALETDGQALLTPIGGEVRPQDVIEATHQPAADVVAITAGRGDYPNEPEEVLPPAAAETSDEDGSSSGPALADENGEPIEANAAEPPAEVSDEVRANQRKMHAIAAKVWPDKNDRDTHRKGLISVLTSGRSESSNDLTDEEWRDAWDAFELLELGAHEVFRRANGEWTLKPIPAGRRTSTTKARS